MDYMRREQLQVDTIIKKQIIELNDKGVVDFTVDPRVNFHLDTTKIAFHKERVDAWKAGKKVAPITIVMLGYSKIHLLQFHGKNMNSFSMIVLILVMHQEKE
jgi:hypothetical protein